MPNPVFFFGGGDTAPSEQQKSDDGALVVLAGTPRRQLSPGEPLPKFEHEWYLDYIYARIFNHKHRLTARQWAGFIYALDRRFQFTQFTLDAGAGGGGVYVKREMMSDRQLIDGVEQAVVPICDKTIESQQAVGHARFILNMFKRGDPGIEAVWPAPDGVGKSLAGDDLLKDALMCAMREAFNMGVPRFPPDADEFLKTHAAQCAEWGGLPSERVWALRNLTVMWKQLINIIVETNEKDGQLVQVYTSRGARKFSTVGKDDVGYAGLYAYTSFRVWLQGEEFEQPPDEDTVGFAGR